MSETAAMPSLRARFGLWDSLLLVVLLLGIWQALAAWTRGIAIAAPAATLVYLGNLVRTSNFWTHVHATIEALLIAYAISAIAGLLLGLVFGLRRFAGDVAEPILAGIYTIPKVTLYPVVLLVFGLGISAKIAFGVLHGLIPVILFTFGAVRMMPPVLMRTARILRLDARQAMTLVLIPACLPEIVNGLRVGFSLSLLGVLIGEMFSSQEGLGFLLMNSLAQNNVTLATSIVLILVLFAVAANVLTLRLGRLLTHRT